MRPSFTLRARLVSSFLILVASGATACQVAPWSPGRLRLHVASFTEGVFDADGNELYRWDGQGHQIEVVIELPAGDYVLVSAMGPPDCAPGMPIHIDGGRELVELWAPMTPTFAGRSQTCYRQP